MKLLLIIAVSMVALAVFQSVYYYPQLPETMASHFNFDGEANAWSSRNRFFGLYFCIMLTVLAVFLVIPLWISKRKNRRGEISQNNQDSRFFIRQQFLILCLVNMIFLIDVAQMAILANLDPEPRISDNIFLSMLVYSLIFVGWLVHFFLHLRKHN